MPANATVAAMVYGITKEEADRRIAAGSCVACGQEHPAFRDRTSEREFAVSGLCQACQDVAFGSGDED